MIRTDGRRTIANATPRKPRVRLTPSGWELIGERTFMDNVLDELLTGAEEVQRYDHDEEPTDAYLESLDADFEDEPDAGSVDGGW